jgi:myo-inositol 2-dehydrogenase / D-chiro-inositol 1-dehydrogenase
VTVSHERFPSHVAQASDYSRRQFLGSTMAAAASGAWLGAAASPAAEQPAVETRPAQFDRKIKLGIVGCGGRGTWIAQRFQEHGGYNFHAIADYFPEAVERGGEAAGVDPARRFSGLSGYKRVIASGVEAVVLIVPPCFLAEQASAAVAAGLHVYMAKPVGVDVFSCLRVEAAGKEATKNKKVLFVDYQLPVHPGNIEVAERVRKEGLGKLSKVSTVCVAGGRPDPVKTANVESRLRNLVWDNDTDIGGSYIVSYDIHALDAAVWILGRRPVAAMGDSRICRADPHGDAHDVYTIIYEYADGLLHEHSGQALPNGADREISCTLFGQTGHARLDYYDRAHFHRRGEKPLTVDLTIGNMNTMGVIHNIAAFYEDVIAGRFENPSVQRAVDGCLTCILGREAGFRHGRMTMEQLLKENRRVEPDLSGLKD